ncbi:MAG TPA: hypothetical protein PK205_18150 [Promineifilum sp.]|nr:hypothetical protein [Promineifilum sp.]HRQ15227.1 hypothetical protein [Promineifilum sp.]
MVAYDLSGGKFDCGSVQAPIRRGMIFPYRIDTSPGAPNVKLNCSQLLSGFPDDEPGRSTLKGIGSTFLADRPALSDPVI